MIQRLLSISINTSWKFGQATSRVSGKDYLVTFPLELTFIYFPRQHEDQILLCCEVSCKVLRTDTVYDQIQEILKRGGAGANFHKQVEKVLLGAIVITRYNNKTYKIDEIAWDKSPMEVILIQF